MKRIGLGIVALGLSLSALTLSGRSANAAEPCAPAPAAAVWLLRQPGLQVWL
jgi:hypothetical protein